MSYTFKAAKLIPKIGCVYVITNTINGKEYVGKTDNLRRRVCKHMSVVATGEQILYRAIRKYGIDSFAISVASTASDLFQLEVETIRLRNTMAPNGYNMTLGGEGQLGCRASEATLKKKRDYAATEPDHIKKFKSFVRLPKSAEHRLAISLANQRPKTIVRYGAEAPSSKSVVMFEGDSTTGRYFDTQKDVANYLGVDKTSVGNWLKGRPCRLPRITLASA